MSLFYRHIIVILPFLWALYTIAILSHLDHRPNLLLIHSAHPHIPRYILIIIFISLRQALRTRHPSSRLPLWTVPANFAMVPSCLSHQTASISSLLPLIVTLFVTTLIIQSGCAYHIPFIYTFQYNHRLHIRIVSSERFQLPYLCTLIRFTTSFIRFISYPCFHTSARCFVAP